MTMMNVPFARATRNHEKQPPLFSRGNDASPHSPFPVPDSRCRFPVSRFPNPLARRRLPILLALVALACLSVIQTGCGLGTVGIVVAVMAGGGGSDDGTPEPGPPLPPPSILFSEDFETDLSQWTSAGSPAPSLAADGLDGQGLDPGGATGSNGEIVTRYAFNLDPGVTARANLRVPVLGASDADVWFGFKDSFAADGRSDLLAGVYLSAASSQIRLFVNGSIEDTKALPDTDWHRFELYLRPDGRAEVYVDGGLLTLSASPVDPLADYRPLGAGGRSVGADVRVDEIEVFGYKPVRDVAFADSFGTDLSAWTVGAAGGSDPSIDTSTQGAPPPSLNPGGAVGAPGEAVTNDTFSFTANGLEIRADLYIGQVGVDGIEAWMGLGRQAGLAAGVAFEPTAGGTQIRYIFDGGDALIESPASPGWHTVRLLVREGSAGWHVEYHVDGRLVLVSANSLPSSYDNSPVSVGGESASGVARIDNVAVLSPPLFQAPLWTPLSDTGAAPSANIQGHFMVWDLQWNRALVFFGGDGLNPSNDVVALSASGSTASWTTLAPGGASEPPDRVLASGAFAAWDDAVYAVGGGSDASGTTLYDDVWKLDVATDANGAWSLEAQGTGPSPRFGHTVVADPANNRLLLFGGEDAGGVQDDVWAFDTSGGTWSAVTTTGGPPSARRRHAAVFDAANHRMIVFGGEDLSQAPPADDLWSLDFNADPPAWIALNPGGDAPAARSRAAAAVDTARRRMYVYGGTDAPAAATFHELRTLDLAGGGDGVWSADMLADPLGTPHAPQTCASMTFDPLTHRLLLVGGAGALGSAATEGDLEDQRP